MQKFPPQEPFQTQFASSGVAEGSSRAMIQGFSERPAFDWRFDREERKLGVACLGRRRFLEHGMLRRYADCLQRLERRGDKVEQMPLLVRLLLVLA